MNLRPETLAVGHHGWTRRWDVLGDAAAAAPAAQLRPARGVGAEDAGVCRRPPFCVSCHSSTPWLRGSRAEEGARLAQSSVRGLGAVSLSCAGRSKARPRCSRSAWGSRSEAACSVAGSRLALWPCRSALSKTSVKLDCCEREAEVPPRGAAVAVGDAVVLRRMMGRGNLNGELGYVFDEVEDRGRWGLEGCW